MLKILIDLMILAVIATAIARGFAWARQGTATPAARTPSLYPVARAIGRFLGWMLSHWQVWVVMAGAIVSAYCFAKAGVIDLPLMQTVPNKWAYGLAGAGVLLLSIVFALMFQPKKAGGEDGGGKDKKKEATDPRFRKLVFALLVATLALGLAHLNMELHQGGSGSTALYVLVVIIACVFAIALEDSATQLFYLIAIIFGVVAVLWYNPVLTIMAKVDNLPPGETYAKALAVKEDFEADVVANRRGFSQSVINMAHVAQVNKWAPAACKQEFVRLVSLAGYEVEADEPIDWCRLMCNLGKQIGDLTLPTDFEDLRQPRIIAEVVPAWVRELHNHKMDGMVKLIEDPWRGSATCEPIPERKD